MRIIKEGWIKRRNGIGTAPTGPKPDIKAPGQKPKEAEKKQ